MTTLEAAAEFGYFDTKEATAFCKQHDLDFKDAADDAHGESSTKLAQHHAQTLLNWLGY